VSPVLVLVCSFFILLLVYVYNTIHVASGGDWRSTWCAWYATRWTSGLPKTHRVSLHFYNVNF
jgi:hypothetical protein